MVGTNTIRQNYSREGSLDYIVHNGGTITEAVSTQVWSGEAAVHVSIVDWVKGEEPGKKRLYRQLGDRKDSDFEVLELDYINSALSGKLDVTGAKRLRTNKESGTCYQGQTHGHRGFMLETYRDHMRLRAEPDADYTRLAEHALFTAETIYNYTELDSPGWEHTVRGILDANKQFIFSTDNFPCEEYEPDFVGFVENHLARKCARQTASNKNAKLLEASEPGELRTLTLLGG